MSEILVPALLALVSLAVFRYGANSRDSQDRQRPAPAPVCAPRPALPRPLARRRPASSGRLRHVPGRTSEDHEQTAGRIGTPSTQPPSAKGNR